MPPLRRPQRVRPDRGGAAAGVGASTRHQREATSRPASPEKTTHVARRRHRARRARTGRAKGCCSSLEGIARPGRRPEPRPRRSAAVGARDPRSARAPKMPLVLVLSDLHWASDDTLELCERLLTRLRNRPFVLDRDRAPRHRDALESRAGQVQRHHAPARPARRARDRRARARAARRRDADPELVTLLLERSGGNPFFIEELVAFMQESGDTASIREVPATLHGLLAARLDALDPGRALAARRLRGRRRQRPDRRGRAASPTAPTRSALLDRLAERDLDRARRRRVPLQVRPHPRDRVRHAHEGRAAPDATLGSRRCSKRAARRRSTRSRITSRPPPSSSASSARFPACPPTCASRRSPRSGAPPTAPSASSRGCVFGHHQRPRARPAPARARARAVARAARPGQGRGAAAAASTPPATTSSSCSPRPPRRASCARRPKRSRCSARPRSNVGAYDVADETFADALERWREIGDEAGGADVLRELGVSHLFRGDLVQAERFVSEALAVVPVGRPRARRGVGAPEPRVDLVHQRRHPARRGAAPAVGRRVRRARRLGRPRLGLRTARVRPLQPGPPRRGRRARRAHRDRRPRDRQPLGRRHDGRAARRTCGSGAAG